MSPNKPESPENAQVSADKPAAKTERSDRLAAALRDNLKRRKVQARARREPPSGHRQD
jgi:hypothetical protein